MFACASGLAQHSDWHLVWSVQPLLDVQRVPVQSLRQLLGMRSPPPLSAVLQHLQTVRLLVAVHMAFQPHWTGGMLLSSMDVGMRFPPPFTHVANALHVLVQRIMRQESEVRLPACLTSNSLLLASQHSQN